MATRQLQASSKAHGELKRLAVLLGVSERTLYAWRRGGAPRRPGRPSAARVTYSEAREWIEPSWRQLVRGHNGVRSVRACLARAGRYVPKRQAAAIVRELKAERDARERRRMRASRRSVKVLAKDAVWALDQMQIGADEFGGIHALQVCDARSQLTLSSSVGAPACGTDVLALVDAAAARRGVYPLVLQVDNGSENRNELVEAGLRDRQVVLQWNLPRTPQHNARAERKNGDLKRAAELDAASSTEGPASRVEYAQRIVQAWQRLDACTPRASLGNLTPLELDRLAVPAEDRACRARFYREVCEAQQRIAQLPCNARERRLLCREAIWSALEERGLVQCTRGGLPVRAFKSEAVT